MKEINQNNYIRPPRTIGCLAIAYLAEGALEESNKVQFYIKGIIDNLITNLKGEDEILKEFSLLLLSRCAEYVSEGSIHEMLDQKILESLVPLLKHPILQDDAIKASGFIYKSREKAQQIFIRLEGDLELLKILKSADTTSKINLVLLNIFYLVLDAQSRPNQVSVDRLILIGFLEALDKIDEKNVNFI